MTLTTAAGSMEITIRERQGVQILDLVGRLALNQGAEQLYLTVRKSLDMGQKRILIHLSRVVFIDSTGLGRLIACLTSAGSREGSVKLLSPSPKVQDVLDITGTSQLFEIFQDEDEVIASFSSQA